MSFSSKSFWFTFFSVMLVLASTNGYATNVGAPKHPSSGVGVPGTPTPKHTANSPQLFTSEWSITLLTSATGLIPQEVSRDGKIVLLHDSNDPATFFRWSANSLETLGTASNPGNLTSYFQNVGKLLINNGNVGLDPSLNSGGTFNTGATMNNIGTIVLNPHVEMGTPENGNGYTIGPIKLFQPNDSSPSLTYVPRFRMYSHSDSYSGTTWVSRNQSAELVAVDDQNRTWFFGQDLSDSESSVPTTTGLNYSLHLEPFVRAVSKNGHNITEADTSYIDGNPTNLSPFYINDRGTVLAFDPAHGYQVVRYPNGLIDVLPDGPTGSYLSLDNQDRVNGWYSSYLSGANSGKRPFLFTKKLDGNGQPVSPLQYEVTPYVTLTFPSDSGWTTNQVFAPGTLVPQIGVAVNTVTGKSVPFVANPRIQLSVDANRDGVISADRSDETSADSPFRFWVNDDDDSGDLDGTDIPMSVDVSGSGPMGPANWQGSGTDFKVHGTRDLIDLFPVFLDIKQLIAALPPGGNAVYKLKQEESAVNFVYTGLTCADALKYQTQKTDAIFGPSLNQFAEQADKKWITASGVSLFSDTSGSPQFLDAIQNHEGGVILLEGRKGTDKPLVLSVEKSDGTVIFQVKLEMKINAVEQMFRHLDLRNGPDAPAGLIGGTGPGHAAIATNLSEPVDAFPDELGDPKWLFFVHGFNVSGQKARGWNAETFKRLYWSGSKARFVGVTWFGDPSPDEPVNIVQGYQWAVRNALPSARALAQKANLLSGSKVIMGHSQGCWVASLAVADNDMVVNKAFLVDAAFARECFDGELATDLVNMVPSEWVDYPTWAWASNWYQRFEVNGQSSSDHRSSLKWFNRLSSMLTKTIVHNFYSSTEDVLGAFPGTPTQAVLANIFTPPLDVGRSAWVCNEKSKGNKALFLTQGSDYLGWGFNLNDGMQSSYPKWYVPLPGQNARRLQTPSEIAGRSTAELLIGIKFNPLFKSGWGKFDPSRPAFELVDPSTIAGPEWIEDLFDNSLGSAAANTNHTQLLAEGIPALSLPVGSNLTTSIGDRNHDMPNLYASTDWPRGNKRDTEVADWHHSDMREVAYIYMNKFFKRIADESQ